MSLNLSYIFINIPNPKLECLFAVPQIALIFQYNRLSAKSKDPSCIRTYHEKGPLDFCRVHGSEKKSAQLQNKISASARIFQLFFFLLSSQRIDRIQICCFYRRQQSEYNTDHHGEYHGEDDRRNADCHRCL